MNTIKTKNVSIQEYSHKKSKAIELVTLILTSLNKHNYKELISQDIKDIAKAKKSLRDIEENIKKQIQESITPENTSNKEITNNEEMDQEILEKINKAKEKDEEYNSQKSRLLKQQKELQEKKQQFKKDLLSKSLLDIYTPKNLSKEEQVKLEDITIEQLLSDDLDFNTISRIKELYEDEGVRAIFEEEFQNRQPGLEKIRKGQQKLEKINENKKTIEALQEKKLQIRVKCRKENRETSIKEQTILKLLNDKITGLQGSQKHYLRSQEVAQANRLQELQTYKKQLDSSGFITTPSRQAIVDNITEKILLGKNILLTGPTGTGKTVLAVESVKKIGKQISQINGKQISGELENIPKEELTKLNNKDFVEVLSGHAGMTVGELIAKKGLKEGAQGGTETITELGKLLRAFTTGKIPVIDEIDLIPNDILMRIKHLFTLKPGSKYSVQEDGNHLYDLKNTTIIATANIKSEKHPDRQDVDPAIVRLFDNQEVTYLPKEETYDVALAYLMEKEGFIQKISPEELQKGSVIYNLIDALKEIEDNYMGKIEESIDTSTSTNKKVFLKKAVLELGKFTGLFKGYKTSQQSFSKYIKSEIIDFVSNGAYPKNDRLILIKIFSGKGFITKSDTKQIAGKSSDLSQKELESNILQDKYDFAEGKVKFIDPMELANLDPYKTRNFDKLSSKSDELSKVKKHLNSLEEELIILEAEGKHSKNIASIKQGINKISQSDKINPEDINDIMTDIDNLLEEEFIPELKEKSNYFNKYRKNKSIKPLEEVETLENIITEGNISNDTNKEIKKSEDFKSIEDIIKLIGKEKTFKEYLDFGTNSDETRVFDMIGKLIKDQSITEEEGSKIVKHIHDNIL